MRYVYEGNAALKSSEYKSAKNLLGAAHYFQLEGLKRKCEIFLSKNLSVENCVSVYKAAKVRRTSQAHVLSCIIFRSYPTLPKSIITHPIIAYCFASASEM